MHRLLLLAKMSTAFTLDDTWHT